MILFKCKHNFSDGEVKEWIGKVEKVKNYGSHYEAIVLAEGSSNNIVFGKYSGGWFIVLPLWDVGTSLSTDLDDIKYNKEKLIEITENEIDGTTIAYALSAICNNIIKQ